jgi:NAD(P)-dependent dehydrogenase (short-subunit alcohol dehydrogenase family)
MGKLDGRYTVVTGGGKGIGQKIVERFAAEGAAGIAILDYDLESAQKTAESLNYGGKVVVIHCDVSDAVKVADAFKQVYEAFGRVDVLINNAGITRDAMLHKMSIEQWDSVIDANLKSAFLCLQQVVAGMREQEYGKIVNISSTSAFGNVGQTNYSASKAGMLGLTATAAKELGRKNITVNAVLPGFIETDMLKAVPEPTRAMWRTVIPMGRFGEPEELANVVLFFSCDESSFVSGSSITCAGGGAISY